MSKRPRHRPQRSYPDAERVIVECELEECIHCGGVLVSSGTWHVRKYVQTLNGPLFVAGRSKKCDTADCSHPGHHYHASGVLRISLPQSTYGLDVLAFIGWQHEREHKQLVEIHGLLNRRGVEVSARHVARLYRQFLALLGGMNATVKHCLEEVVKEHGGLIWGIDALQPEGCGTSLYVLYEVLSGTPVAGIQLDHPTEDELAAWLKPYQELPYAVLATLSDGEKAIIAALERCWPDAPRQRCQEHALGNLAEPVLKVDEQLRQWMRNDLGELPGVPLESETPPVGEEGSGEMAAAPPFLPDARAWRDHELVEIEAQVRVAIRDAVNRPSRKPFYWGGLKGYEQLEAIAQALGEVSSGELETDYLRRLKVRVDRVVETYRVNVADLREAHAWLRQIADCLRYPPGDFTPEPSLTGEQVKQEMEALLQSFQPDLKRQPAQAALYGVWQRTWKAYGSDLLHCYDISGLPPDNLMLESLFGRLRRHQRRVSGKKSTRELRDMGQCQVLFLAQNEEELLEQIRQVSLAEYRKNRRRLEEATAPHRLLRRLHRDPLATLRALVRQHAARRSTLASASGQSSSISDV